VVSVKPAESPGCLVESGVEAEREEAGRPGRRPQLLSRVENSKADNKVGIRGQI
jgi:hypothetical protein